jgi:hypothetical protein
MHLDMGAVPVEAVLLVADVADGAAHQGHDLALAQRHAAAHLAGEDDAVGGGERLARHLGGGILAEIAVDDGVGDAVAHLVGVALGDRFAGENVVAVALHGKRPG